MSLRYSSNDGISSAIKCSLLEVAPLHPYINQLCVGLNSSNDHIKGLIGTFLPERCLDTGDSRFENDSKSALQPFSFGPRNCLGKNLAFVEMHLILCNILWHFDLELGPESENWDDQKSYTLWDKPPLLVKLSPATIES